MCLFDFEVTTTLYCRIWVSEACWLGSNMFLFLRDVHLPLISLFVWMLFGSNCKTTLFILSDQSCVFVDMRHYIAPHVTIFTTKFENGKNMFYDFNTWIKQSYYPRFITLLFLKISPTKPILGYSLENN